MPSDEDQKSLSTEYLFDYLYIDTQRLDYYYSQLSDDGLIVESKKSSRSSGKQDSKLSAGPRFFKGEHTQSTTGEEGIESKIDHAFTRPQDALNALHERGYLADHMGAIGQLCMLEGLLSIVDVRMLREIWPLFGTVVAAQAAADIANPKEKQRKIAEGKKEFEALAEIIKHMPHALQGSFATAKGAGWFTLKPEFMQINPDDLMLKTGMDIAGLWHMAFIIDAYPDEILLADHSAIFDHPLEVMMRDISIQFRQQFGRPAGRYGITPIMIFRKVEQHKKPKIADGDGGDE